MSNREKEKNGKNEEKNQLSWISMREKGLNVSDHKEIGPFAWNPRFIPSGEHLMMSPTEAQKMGDLLQIGQITLLSYRLNKNADQHQISGNIEKDGSISLLSAKTIKERKRFSQFVHSKETGGNYLLVDFFKVIEELENTLPNGKNNPTFFQEYGKKINTLIIENLSIAPYIHSIQSDDSYFYESVNAVWPVFLVGINTLTGIAEVLKNPSLFDDFLLSLIITYESGWLLINLLTILGLTFFSSEKVSAEEVHNYIDTYKKYLLENAKRGNIARILLPLRTLDNLSKQVQIKNNSKPLIKGS